MSASNETVIVQEKQNAVAVALASSSEEVRACQRLRYQIFAGEMGARLDTDIAGLDHDQFDPLCQHLLVRDLNSGAIVGTTRFLVGNGADSQTTFYSQTEFDLAPVMRLPGSFMEVGRTCIHADYRNGATIATLWQGLARAALLNRVDYLFGCASIPLDNGPASAHAVMQDIRHRYLSPEDLRVTPLHPLPPAANVTDISAQIPPLLKAYLRLGAVICGEPCWDEDFNVADVFVLVARERLERRYARHFLKAG